MHVLANRGIRVARQERQRRRASVSQKPRFRLSFSSAAALAHSDGSGSFRSFSAAMLCFNCWVANGGILPVIL